MSQRAFLTWSLHSEKQLRDHGLEIAGMEEGRRGGGGGRLGYIRPGSLDLMSQTTALTLPSNAGSLPAPTWCPSAQLWAASSATSPSSARGSCCGRCVAKASPHWSRASSAREPSWWTASWRSSTTGLTGSACPSRPALWTGMNTPKQVGFFEFG